ncbi:auxin-responsive protein IAA16-like [Musa acuminata AAA Group]|uniref:auxin-responsive protein IAA16 n=1 Tax=Musa acuminata AAA Group TaxID=214697 RepID=UPI0031CE24F2
MEEEFTRGEGRPRLLDLIPNGRDWGSYAAAEEKKLELRLGLPGGEDWSAGQEKREHPVESPLSLDHISKVRKSTNVNASSSSKRGFLVQVEPKTEAFQQQQLQQQQLGFLQLQAKGKESLQKTSGSAEQQSLEGKGCGPHAAHASSTKNAAVAHTASQSRAAATPVVGWPPVRSFRMNLAGTAKASAESHNGSSEVAKKLENDRKSLFVKINMDGIPIGRKVDLKAYDSYDKLSLAVDELFRGLMAAQADPLAPSIRKNSEEKHVLIGLLDGSGEYTLVYEDDEGDRMLVGDVPWDMFVSMAKRLRVLKSSDLSASSLRAVGRKRTSNS